jgi:ketosteroid isomerase-like protein
MKRSLICCSLGVVLLVVAAWSQVGNPEKTVADLEQTWLKSQQTNNPDMIVPYLADKFIETESDGKVIDKAEATAESRKMKYTSAENENVKVTVFGNTAIVTGGSRSKGTDSQGKPFDTHERWTDTWVKMPNGKWQCVATQATPLKM